MGISGSLKKLLNNGGGGGDGVEVCVCVFWRGSHSVRAYVCVCNL